MSKDAFTDFLAIVPETKVEEKGQKVHKHPKQELVLVVQLYVYTNLISLAV